MHYQNANTYCTYISSICCSCSPPYHKQRISFRRIRYDPSGLRDVTRLCHALRLGVNPMGVPQVETRNRWCMSMSWEDQHHYNPVRLKVGCAFDEIAAFICLRSWLSIWWNWRERERERNGGVWVLYVASIRKWVQNYLYYISILVLLEYVMRLYYQLTYLCIYT